MKLTNSKNNTLTGYTPAKFDVEEMRTKTAKNCKWIHFGAGNIFRGFPAARMQDLLEMGLSDTGIVVGEGFDFEIIDDIYHKYDNNTLLVTLKGNGSVDKRIISSVAASYKASTTEKKDYEALSNIFKNPSFQMASFTITEKGYNVDSQFIQNDINKGPLCCQTIIPTVTSLALQRFNSGKLPFAFVSMDNCSHNGEKLKDSILKTANIWLEKKYISKEFIEYLSDPQYVTFPWSMIDKITPRPDEKIKQMLIADGFEDTDILITKKNTYIAPFVNCEESEYLVIEDSFPNGRPQLDKVGIYFTDRSTVNKVEKMKVCTCLNPLHTAMSVIGCLLGFTKISEEMKDADIVKYIKGIGFDEGLKVVVDPKILSPKAFINDVVTNRLVNPYMPDTPQRIVTDTSQKIPIRFGESVKAYMAHETLDEDNLKLIPFFMATYIRYLMAIDDKGNSFELSPDPRLEELRAYVSDLKLGKYSDEYIENKLTPILKLDDLWGFNLFDSKLKNKVINNFKNMILSKDSVRESLHNILNNLEI